MGNFFSWTSEQPDSVSKLKTRDVVLVLQPTTVSVVKRLMLHLGVSLRDLDNIERQYPDVENQVMHFVARWLEIDGSASWEKLGLGLQEINMETLASDIRSKYCISEHNIVTPTSGSTTGSASTSRQEPVSIPAELQVVHVHQNTKEVEIHTKASAPASYTGRPSSPAIEHSAVSQEKVTEVKMRIAHFKRIFFDLMMAILMLASKKVEQDHSLLKIFLMTLPVSKKPIYAPLLLGKESEICKAKNAPELCAILNPYCDYTNYELIMHLIGRMCKPEETLAQEITEYHESFVKYEKSTTIDVFLCAIEAEPNSEICAGFSQMSMMIKKSPCECTLYDIRKLRESIAENANVNSYAVYIGKPNKGSVTVVLFFPPLYGKLVTAAMTPEFQRAHHLTGVTVNGQDIATYQVYTRTMGT